MDKMSKKRATFSLWEVLGIALISALIMSGTTGYVVYKNRSVTGYGVNGDNPHINEFINSYNSLLNEYYTDIDESGLVDAAISGMMNYLNDPYTTYLNENSSDYLMDTLKGTYEGIGIEITETEEGLIKIANVFVKSPAEKAGLLVNDIITAVNETDVTGKTATEVVAIIKANDDKNVKINVRRGEELLDFTLVRATLYVPVIAEQIFENNGQKIGYLGVSRFSETVGEQFKAKLLELEDQNINGLIIDVRANAGGYLKGASDIASLFLKQGSLMYSLKTKLETTKEKVKTSETRDYKVYILIDKGSASASEVLAAALRYSYKNALLVGETSYGKGKVQQTNKLSGGSMLKYTTAEWLTPKGECIDGIGLSPDVVISLNEEYANNPTQENDNQLQTAIYEISK